MASATQHNINELISLHPALGSTRETDGAIWTTCGWAPRGRVWVTAEQLADAACHSWSATGRTAPFQTYMLHEVAR
jgi:hypothetical protein